MGRAVAGQGCPTSPIEVHQVLFTDCVAVSFCELLDLGKIEPKTWWLHFIAPFGCCRLSILISPHCLLLSSGRSNTFTIFVAVNFILFCADRCRQGRWCNGAKPPPTAVSGTAMPERAPCFGKQISIHFAPLHQRPTAPLYDYLEQFANSPYSSLVDREAVEKHFVPILNAVERGVEQKIIKDVDRNFHAAFMFFRFPGLPIHACATVWK